MALSEKGNYNRNKKAKSFKSQNRDRSHCYGHTQSNNTKKTK